MSLKDELDAQTAKLRGLRSHGNADIRYRGKQGRARLAQKVQEKREIARQIKEAGDAVRT